MSTGGLSSADLPDVDAYEERQIREDYDEVVITSLRSHQGKRLHLATQDEKECDHYMNGEPLRKSFAVFPPGHRKICRECAEIWRRSR